MGGDGTWLQTKILLHMRWGTENIALEISSIEIMLRQESILGVNELREEKSSED